MKTVSLWWMKKGNNFGDLLTPYIFDYFNIPYQFTNKKTADTICIGSIAGLAKDNTHVLGSGIMRQKDNLNLNARWKFVRGPYTRKKILASSNNCPDKFGDPALLLPLIAKESKKEYEIGIVPHFVDYSDIEKEYPNYNVINLVNDNPITVAKEITKCKKIISTSLHGIICAHAYGIPAAWCKYSSRLNGDDIKFHDHYEAVGLSAEKSTIEKPKFTTGKFDIDFLCNMFEEFKNEY